VLMSTTPLDTTSEAWLVQREALARMGGEARVQTAIELSEAVRVLQMEGILARNPGWSRSEAIQYLLRQMAPASLP
jgi:hypothetical protein